MAKAEVRCTCKHCGNTFVKYATKHNRAEADRWEEWAKDYFDTCPECYRNKQAIKETSIADSFRAQISFPALTGTEKQISYANSLINEYLADNETLIKMYVQIKNQVETLTESELKAIADKNNVTVDELIKQNLYQKSFETINKIVTISYAGDVISLLK